MLAFQIVWGQQVSLESEPLIKYHYLNEVGRTGRTEAERQFDRDLLDSFSPKDITVISNYIEQQHLTKSTGSIKAYCKIIVRFDELQVKYDRDACIDLIINILDSYKDNPDLFSLHLQSASRILDSRLLNYINSQAVSKSEYCKSMVKSMNERWSENQHTKHHSPSGSSARHPVERKQKSPPEDQSDQNFMLKKTYFAVALLVAIAIGAFIYKKRCEFR